MADTDLVTVVLDASTGEDIQSRIDRVPPGQWRLRKAIRMCRQAYEQGGLLNNQDLSEILNFSDSLIAQLLSSHERQTKTPTWVSPTTQIGFRLSETCFLN